MVQDVFDTRLLHVRFFGAFWHFRIFCFSGAIGFGMREKKGAWAPAAVAGEEGEQEVTNAAFRPCWREQLRGQGG